MRARRPALVVAALGLTATAGCGGGDVGGSSAAKDGATLPACLATVSPSPVPTEGTFPTDWAFPPGTVVTGTETVPGGGLAVTAQVGSDFEKVLPFMQHDLEDAGFVATKGEAEDNDAEATWSGRGYNGTWAIRGSDECPGTTILQVAAARQPG